MQRAFSGADRQLINPADVAYATANAVADQGHGGDAAFSCQQPRGMKDFHGGGILLTTVIRDLLRIVSSIIAHLNTRDGSQNSVAEKSCVL